jgi:hypothetical protein
LTKSDRDDVFITANSVCGPDGTALAFAVTVLHFCQLPVEVTGNVASNFPVRLPRCNSTEPPAEF